MMRSFVVTGAAGGIGVETVKVLAAPDRELICVDIQEDRVNALKKLGLPGIITPIMAELTAFVACAEVAERAGTNFGGLVHLAAVLRDDRHVNADLGLWDQVCDIGLKAAYMLTGELLRNVDPQAQIKLVYASSAAFRRGAPNNIAYSVSKAGIAGLVRSLSRKLGAVANVNAVAPGPLQTEMTTTLLKERGADFLKAIPFGRFGEAQEIAAVIAFLCSDAASYITGQVINVDGV